MAPRRLTNGTSPRSKKRGLVQGLLLGASLGMLLLLVAFLALMGLDGHGSSGRPVGGPPPPADEATEAPSSSYAATAAPPVRPPVPPTKPTRGIQPGNEGQAILNRCLQGTVAFRYPEPLKQGETVEFVVRAVLRGSPADPTEGLPGQGPAQKRTTRTCERMRAELSGPDMVITRTGNQSGEISLPSQGMGEWVWQVKPQKSGTQYLTLRLFVPGPGDSDITLESFTERIQVEVGVAYVVAGFVKDYFPALGISVPIILGWVAWVVHKRSKGKHAKATE